MEASGGTAVGSALADPDRLQALQATGLLDAEPAPLARHVVRLAQRLLAVPVALITLIDRDRQFLAADAGMAEPWHSERQTPLSMSLCQYSIASGQPLIIPDTRQDPLVRTSRAVSDLGVIAYAGIPLITDEGHVLGSLCAIDHQPRSWAAADTRLLEELAGLARTEIQYRLKLHQLARADRELGRLGAPVAKLGDAITAMAAISRNLSPRVSRVASLVQERFEELASVSDELGRLRSTLAKPMDRRLLPVDLVDQVVRAVDLAAPGAVADAVRLHLIDPVVALVCEPEDLERSLVHMLVSSLHQVVEDEPVEVWLNTDGDLGLIKVTYTGAPMPAVDVARVLSLVHRGTCDLPEGHDHGTGGLTLVGGGIQVEHGPIRVHSDENRSELVLRLPLASGGGSERCWP